jgi:hypothetical protein
MEKLSWSSLPALVVGLLIGLLSSHVFSARRPPQGHWGQRRKCGHSRLIGDLFTEQKSDKMTRHGYHRFYDEILPPCDAEVRLIESGVSTGHSMRSWERYFTAKTSRFFGVAYKNKLTERMDDPRSQILSGDQSNVTFLKVLTETAGSVDIVVDDGSHVPHHMLLSLEKIWPIVRPGGYYVIEDTETSYYASWSDVMMNPLKQERSVYNHFFSLVHNEVNHEFVGKLANAASLPGLVSVQFGLGIIILRKAEAADSEWMRLTPKWDAHRYPHSQEDRLPGSSVCDCPLTGGAPGQKLCSRAA